MAAVAKCKIKSWLSPEKSILFLVSFMGIQILECCEMYHRAVVPSTKMQDYHLPKI
jgi:hypothetical protein